MRNGLILLLGCLGFLPISSFAQNVSQSAKSIRSTNILNRLTTGGLGTGDVVMLGPTNDPSEIQILGDSYWDTHWGASSIELFDNSNQVEGYLTRYDIKKDEFEFKLQKGIKVLPGRLVKNMVWIDSATQFTRVIVNGSYYQEDGVPLTGFLELLSEGEYMLVKRIKVEVLKPNFNPALNVGSKDYRIVKHEHFYYNMGKELVEIKSKKSLAPLIEKYPAIDKHVKAENTKFNNEISLQRLFTFISSLAPVKQD